MQNNMQATLGEIVEIFDGPHATPKKTDSGPVYLSISSLKQGRFDLSESAHLSDKDYTKWAKRVVPTAGDLLFSYETRLGEAALMPKNLKACLGRRMGLLRPKKGKVTPEYLLYAYLSPGFQQQILSNTIRGATVDRISLTELPKFKIYVPKIEQQQAIASTLAALDAKIDCNNRINAELEAMAKALYDYWFVQFDFPDENGKPYKSSGGKMVYNEVLKREIPVGWKSSNILELAELLGGGTPTKKKPENWNGHIPFFTPSDTDGNVFKFDTTDKITKEGLVNSSTKLFKENTVFITARGSVGRTVLAGVKMAMNQSCYALCAKQGISYAYLFFLAKELVHHLEVKSSGSVFDSIVTTDIELSSLVIPHLQVIKKYSERAEPLFQKINKNTQENIQLAKLRDWLLPMLMNGQVTVGDHANKRSVFPVAAQPEDNYDQHFTAWRDNQALAARGSLDEATLREIFDAMDDDDK